MSYLPFNNSLVRKFLNWKQGDEEDNWRNKAFETLAKRLKKTDPDSFRTFEAVLLKKSEDTPCVALPRSQDGRLQVSHRKMLPHVMYCRIFRWPDLQSQHELKSIARCQFPANKRDPKVCVNPYHYSRVEHSIYPPVVTPRSDNEFANASPPSQSPLSPISAYSQPQGSPNYFQQTPGMAFGSNQTLNPTQESLYYPQPAINFGASSHSSLPEQPYYSVAIESQSPPPSYSSRNAVVPMDDAQSPFGHPNNIEDAWCKIQYSELTKNVGEPFKSSSPRVWVDGFTAPSTHDQSRFSLGVLSNINRNSTIEMTRRAIRKGILLENIDGQIYVKNLSESSIFFHSKNCNVENQLNQHAVVKIEPQKRQKIFEPKVFEHLVQEAINSQSSYDRLYSLNEHCVIKMSFVKGWGSIYQRQDVTSTPCWIEISLLKQYEIIDRYLPQAGSPSMNITSTS